MNFLPLLEAKRDGAVLNDAKIGEIIVAFVAGEIPDYQMAAFLMAVFFRGLSDEETRALTLAMRDSGEILRFPDDSRPLVDKHSTGGVGDKVSLPLAPLLACLGFRVPMISGRGLGITGGTLDKLESIPGFQTGLSRTAIVEQVQTVGCVICAQSADMVPADKLLYALRDVSATVPSIPLITASILSKKLAESLDALVLDVKWGAAAFMTQKADAETLADAMVSLGNNCGTPTEAFLNEMNTPLGRTAGNWLEVVESVECLEGGGPDDLRDLVLECATRLLNMTGKTGDPARVLDSGAAREKWNAMLAAQGADLLAFEAKLKAPPSVFVLEWKAEENCTVVGCDAKIIGEVVRDLGGGRLAKDSVLNLEIGIDRLKKPGEQVEKGEVLARIHAGNQDDAEMARGRLLSSSAIK